LYYNTFNFRILEHESMTRCWSDSFKAGKGFKCIKFTDRSDRKENAVTCRWCSLMQSSDMWCWRSGADLEWVSWVVLLFNRCPLCKRHNTRSALPRYNMQNVRPVETTHTLRCFSKQVMKRQKKKSITNSASSAKQVCEDQGQMTHVQKLWLQTLLTDIGKRFPVWGSRFEFQRRIQSEFCSLILHQFT
jgi:hypothetical protein